MREARRLVKCSRVRTVCATIRYSYIRVMQMYLELLYRMVEFGSTDTVSTCEGTARRKTTLIL